MMLLKFTMGIKPVECLKTGTCHSVQYALIMYYPETCLATCTHTTTHIYYKLPC